MYQHKTYAYVCVAYTVLQLLSDIGVPKLNDGRLFCEQPSCHLNYDIHNRLITGIKFI